MTAVKNNAQNKFVGATNKKQTKIKIKGAICLGGQCLEFIC